MPGAGALGGGGGGVARGHEGARCLLGTWGLGRATRGWRAALSLHDLGPVGELPLGLNISWVSQSMSVSL